MERERELIRIANVCRAMNANAGKAIQQKTEQIAQVGERELSVGALTDLETGQATGTIPAATEDRPRKEASDMVAIKKPSENAFIAWRIRTLVGITNQTEIALKMTEEGVHATQGQVSRWLQQVEDYLKPGNLLPPMSPLTSQPRSIDPQIIDMGERQDSRTLRQRERGDKESR